MIEDDEFTTQVLQVTVEKTLLQALVQEVMRRTANDVGPDPNEQRAALRSLADRLHEYTDSVQVEYADPEILEEVREMARQEIDQWFSKV